MRGSLLLAKASSHVHGSQVNELKRDDDTMEVRLDARTTSADETRALGIQVGDFVAFDPRVEITNGFVRSRHLDDKACVACLLAAVKALHDAGLQPCPDCVSCISATMKRWGTGRRRVSRRRWRSWSRSIWRRWAMGRPLTSSTPRCASRIRADLTITA